MSTVHVVVPDGIDDPDRPSGGNAYDRRICRGLEALGWSVHEHAVPGSWGGAAPGGPPPPAGGGRGRRGRPDGGQDWGIWE